MQDQRNLLVLATYNERENLPRLIAEIQSLIPTIHILVVDDNSPDGTGEWCQTASEADKAIHCLIRTDERGLGSATLLGLQTAIEKEYHLVATMDADFSHPPQSLVELFSAFADDPELEVAIGSRYVPGGRIVGWPWHRRTVSAAINRLTRLLVGLRTKDNSSAFRVYRVSKLSEIDLSNIRANGYGYLEELLFVLNRAKAKFFEVPIEFRDRIHGSSKTSYVEGVRVLGTLVRLTIERWRLPN